MELIEHDEERRAEYEDFDDWWEEKKKQKAERAKPKDRYSSIMDDDDDDDIWRSGYRAAGPNSPYTYGFPSVPSYSSNRYASTYIPKNDKLFPKIGDYGDDIKEFTMTMNHSCVAPLKSLIDAIDRYGGSLYNCMTGMQMKSNTDVMVQVGDFPVVKTPGEKCFYCKGYEKKSLKLGHMVVIVGHTQKTLEIGYIECSKCKFLSMSPEQALELLDQLK